MKLVKRYSPVKYYLSADYIQLEMCTLLHNTAYGGHYTVSACKCILYRGIRLTQDASHHVLPIDMFVQITTASCKTGFLIVCLFSTNFSSLNRHTSTDFEDIFSDYVT